VLTIFRRFSSTAAKGINKTTMKIDFHRSLLDTFTYQTFTEVFATNKEHPELFEIFKRDFTAAQKKKRQIFALLLLHPAPACCRIVVFVIN
jgi:hypothetical protein